MRSTVMKKVKMLRAIWFKSMEERYWFSNQLVTYYAICQKAVVLYALKRLEFVFRMPFTSFDGDSKLVALFDTYKETNKQHWLSCLLPTELHRNPLQIIADDYSCAVDDFERGRTAVSTGQLQLTPLCEHSTVADYVRLIVKYDDFARQTDHLRVTSFLGATPP